MLLCAMAFRRIPLLLVLVLSLAGLLTPALSPAVALAAEPAAKPRPKPKPASPAPPPPLPGADQDPLVVPLGADEGILVDAGTGKVLWQANDTAPRAPASLTKIMTALVVLRRADLNAVSTITPDAVAVGGSETYAPAGTTMTVGDMLWNLLLISGNDTAVALAHTVSPDGTVDGFATLMNQDAAAYGATASHFGNPHGLDQAGHQSTARDLALLTMVAMQNPTFAQMVGTVHHTVPWGGSDHPLTNHDRLLTLFPGTIGVKTGYTDNSGQALVSEVSRGGTTLLAVVMGAKSPGGYNDSEQLYTWGFAHLGELEGKSTDTIKPRIPPALSEPKIAPGQAGAALTAHDAAPAQTMSAAHEPVRGASLAAPLLVFLAASMCLWWCLAVRRRTRQREARALA